MVNILIKTAHVHCMKSRNLVQNSELRKLFCKHKKTFRRIVKFKLKHYRDKIIDNLSLAGGHTKDFWQLIDKLQQSSLGKKVQANDIPTYVWYHHFKALFSKRLKG